MPIVFACPSCGGGQRAGEHLIGRTLRCQDCGKSFVVPAASNAALPAPAPRAPAAAAPPPLFTPPAPVEPQDDDDIFFDHIRKGGNKKRDR